MRIVFLFLVLWQGFGAQAAELTLTTFNIRWFGTGGSPSGGPAKEDRDPYLTEFMYRRTAIGASDVIVFQEIVDVPRLQKILRTHRCTSYQHADPKHQHVVVCVRAPLRFEIERTDNNYTIEEVTSPMPPGRLRPAVHGLLKTPQGQPLAHVIALHLKAMPTETAIRLKQVEVLKKHVEKNLRDGIPVVILGDFNTHKSPVTGRARDDMDLFSAIFARAGFPLQRVPNPHANTYRAGIWSGHFDHIWVGGPARPVAPAAVWKACNPNESAQGANDFGQLGFYNRYVSDHCPVLVKLVVP